jgi:hypothetical protein
MWTGILGEPTLSRVLPRNLKLWGELPAAAGRAFLIAKDAVGNVIELLDGSSPMAYIPCGNASRNSMTSRATSMRSCRMPSPG